LIALRDQLKEENPMDLNQLTYFLAAAQTQNFRQAAERCFVAQSALSRQIAALEDELEAALFTRKKQRVALTPAGQEFALYVKKAMDELQEGRQWLVGLQAGQRGVIKIGCIESLAAALLPALFADFHTRYPQVGIKVVVSHTDELLKMVEMGEVEFGLVLDPHQHSELLVVKEFFRQRLYLLVSAQNPLAQKRDSGVTLDQLVGQPLLLLDETSRMGQIVQEIFDRRGLPIHPLVEIESIEGLKEMVRQGLGVTLTLPALVRPSQVGDELTLLPITDLPEEYIFALVYSRVGSISSAARAFINTVSHEAVLP
jgi:DNA-binding transcriptional LysR family regulator